VTTIGSNDDNAKKLDGVKAQLAWEKEVPKTINQMDFNDLIRWAHGFLNTRVEDGRVPQPAVAGVVQRVNYWAHRDMNVPGVTIDEVRKDLLQLINLVSLEESNKVQMFLNKYNAMAQRIQREINDEEVTNNDSIT
jgi:hypothetical protein